MKYIILILFLIKGSPLYAQKEKRYINKGNQEYKNKNYTAAEGNYRKSLETQKQSLEGSFNLGDALYKQKNYTDAAQKFTDIAASSANTTVKAQAYHNLGNALLENKKLQESVDAYKKSLINNPKDEQTRYNLAYAMEKLKQKQQQDKKDKEKNKDKDKKDKDKKDKDKKDKDKDKNKDKKDEDKNKDPNKPDQDQQKNDPQNGQQPDKLSKEEAERMLQALTNEEKNTQDKLKNKKAKEVKGRIIKDW